MCKGLAVFVLMLGTLMDLSSQRETEEKIKEKRRGGMSTISVPLMLCVREVQFQFQSSSCPLAAHLRNELDRQSSKGTDFGIRRCVCKSEQDQTKRPSEDTSITKSLPSEDTFTIASHQRGRFVSPCGDLKESGRLCFGAFFVRSHTGDYLKHDINNTHVIYVDLSTYL